MCIDETTTMSNNVVGGLASIVFARRGAPCESRTGVGRSTTQNSFRLKDHNGLDLLCGSLTCLAIASIHIPCTNLPAYLHVIAPTRHGTATIAILFRRAAAVRILACYICLYHSTIRGRHQINVPYASCDRKYRSRISTLE